MHNKLLAFARKQKLICPGDRIVCAVSGGADSVALLFALYLMKDTLELSLSAAHFNHHLRGEESDRDEAFVREFCSRYDIPLTVGHGTIVPGKKGLEAAARDARYAFLNSLEGKIATAHTADDNAETVLMHLVRGTGLKGLGGITPVSSNVIRPMLAVTRPEVEACLAEYHGEHLTDSSNETDAFLRNRLRRHVMPLLKGENPALAENVSDMALRLRRDEEYLQMSAENTQMTVTKLREVHASLRSRALESFLRRCGVPEPEKRHIDQLEALVFSENPSAFSRFPGNVTITREYDILRLRKSDVPPEPAELPCPGQLQWGDYRIDCTPVQPGEVGLIPQGTVTVRTRQPGDRIRRSGGSKSLKKLYIDRKIPADLRPFLPVVADELGVLAVGELEIHPDRTAPEGAGFRIQISKIKKAEDR